MTIAARPCAPSSNLSITSRWCSRSLRFPALAPVLLFLTFRRMLPRRLALVAVALTLGAVLLGQGDQPARLAHGEQRDRREWQAEQRARKCKPRHCRPDDADGHGNRLHAVGRGQQRTVVARQADPG